MKNIILNANQIAALQQNKLFVVEPLQKQPPDEYRFVWIKGNVMWFENHAGEVYDIKLPFTPDEKVVGKEPWRLHRTTDMRHHFIEYRDVRFKDVDHEIARISPFGLGIWYSPVTMPKWASRCTVTVKGEPVVKRVQKLTCNELIQLGFPLDIDCGDVSGLSEKQVENLTLGSFIQWWNSKWGKKYPWDADPFIVMMRMEKIK